MILYSRTSFIVDVCFILGSVFWDLTNGGADLTLYSWKCILDNVFFEMFSRYSIPGSVLSVMYSWMCILDIVFLELHSR